MTEQMQSETIGALAAALALAQEQFEPILKSRQVTVTPKKEGARPYTFWYAPLDAVLDATGSALRANGLSLIQPLQGGSPARIRTMLLHTSGEWIASEVSLPATPTTAQELGSLITYLRRYAVSAMLGVTTEEDDDANAGDGNQRTVTSHRADRPAPPRAQPQKPATPKQHGFLLNLMKSSVFSDQEREETELWLSENPPMAKVSKAIDNAQLRLTNAKEPAHA